MLLRLTKVEEIETITQISVDAFHTDYLVGLAPNDGPPNYDKVDWHQKMQAQNCLYTYLDDSKTIIGGAVIFSSHNKVCIGRIFIAPKYHRKGYGTKLMSDIESTFPFAELFTLDTPQNNVRTNAFYQKLGYVQIGTDGDCAAYVKDNKK